MVTFNFFFPIHNIWLEMFSDSTTLTIFLLPALYYFMFKPMKREILAHKQAEEAARVSEEKFSKSFQLSPALVSLSSLEDERYLDVNQKFLDVSGFTRQEVIGKTAVELGWSSAEDRAYLKREIKAHGRITNVELNMRTKDGLVITCLYNGELIEINGKPCLLALSQDITERRRVQNALRESEDLMLEAQRVARLGHYQMDIQNRTWESSSVLDEIFGIDKDAHPDINIWTSVIHPDQRAEVVKYFTDAALNRRQAFVDREYRIVRVNDQETRWVHGKGEVQFDAQEKPVRMIGTIQDITERKQIEQIMLARLRLVEFAAAHSVDELLQATLDEAEILTDSQIGFYHFVEADQNNLALQSWSTRTVREFCKSEGPKLHYPVEQAGVWTDCIHERRAVIHNDYASLPHRKGLPDGHAEVVRVLTIPVIRQDKIVAILGVGNKLQNYVEKDVELVLRLADLSWDIVERKLTEEFQKKTEQNYRDLVETVEGIVWEADAPTFQFSFVSQEAERLLGYPVTRWLKEPNFWEEHIHPEDRDEAINLYARAAKEKIHRQFEYRMIAADNSVIWLRDVITAIVENNRVVKLRGIMIDITAKKQAEDKLRQLSMVVEQSPASVVITDVNGNIQYVNPKFTQVSGYTLEEVVGQNPRILKSSETPSEEYAQLWQTITAGQAWHGEFHNKKKSGELYWEDALISPLSNGGGRTTHFVAVKEDVTERKRLEKERDAIFSELERFFSVVPDLVCIASAKGYFTKVNDAWETTLGYSKEELLSEPFENFIHPDDVELTRKEVERQLAGNYTIRFINRYRHKNGEYRWFEWVATPALEGDVLYAAARDVTERRSAEVEILEKSKELEALFNISAHLRTAQTVEEMIPVVLSQMAQTLKADAGAFILLDENQTSFAYKLGSGLLAENTGKQFDVAGSISGQVMKTLQPYSTNDYDNDPHRSRLMRSNGIGPAVIVPLQSEKEFIGTLLCARAKDRHKDSFTSADIRLLVSIGEMVGNALRRASLYNDALSRLQRVQALRAIDAEINTNLDFQSTLRVLVEQTMSQLKVDAAAVLLYNPNTYTLECATASGFRGKDIEETQHRLDRGFANVAIMERRLVKIPDLSYVPDSLSQELAKNEEFTSCYISPMIAKGQVRGVLEVFNRAPLQPNEEWFDFLESLGAQAAIAIDNAQLFIDLEKSNLNLLLAYDATIAGWSHALDLKDKETEGHTLRVTEWTVKLANLAGFSEDEIAHIRRGALLHDIGKMGVPDKIINKTGELTEEEWDIMRQHPQYAYNMLCPIEFLRPALDIPYCHHEKWDGTGYPRGLQGLGIPYAARLFAVVDVWDALIHARSYHKAWSFKKAVAFIKSQSGKHFDPEAVNLFMKMMDSMYDGSQKKKREDVYSEAKFPTLG